MSGNPQLPPFSPTSGGAAAMAPVNSGYGTSPTPPGGDWYEPEPLGPRWIAFIVLDVILVGVALWMGISYFLGGSAGSNNVAAAGGASASATAASPDPAAVFTDQVFASPTRNITCRMGASNVTCDIAVLNRQPAPNESCNGTVGYRVVLGEVIQMPCVSNEERTAATAAAADMQVLAYERSTTLGNFECTSLRTGLTCKNTTNQKGFQLSKAGVQVLGG